MIKFKNYTHTLKLNTECNDRTQDKINLEERKLNEIILDSFELSNIEKSLIDYAIKVTIPQINNNPKPLSQVNVDDLEKYANIFLNHFGSQWTGNPDYFEIDIYINKYVIGINFKVVDSKPAKFINIIRNEKIEELFQFMEMGEEKITDIFYKQRDIRGFNESSFYIVKPNQYKNWHPAIGYGDLSEFIETLLNAEREELIQENN